MNVEDVRKRAFRAIAPLKSSSDPCFFGMRTDAGRDLPYYYLVYFLLVDLLEFHHIGRDEKVAWSIPVDFNGRLYVIEYRKMGLGVFTQGGSESEEDAKQIVRLIKKGVRDAQRYFEWRSDQALKSPEVNVNNDSVDLFGRYEFMLGLFDSKCRELTNGQTSSSNYELNREIEWLAIAAIESFFSWSEHVFIHLAILQGNCTSGEQVDQLAAKEWKEKFKAALDIQDSTTKRFYDGLLEIRSQVRNFVAHGSFGKNGEAFKFHSGAGAVPIMLSHRRSSQSNRFPDAVSLKLIGEFVDHIKTGPLAPAWIFLDSHLDTVLTEALDGTYDDAMSSEDDMKSFVQNREYIEDMYANMDF